MRLHHVLDMQVV